MSYIYIPEDSHIIVRNDFGCVINNILVFAGDLHAEEHDIDGSNEKVYYPVVFHEGCFHIDESRYRDGTKPDQLTPIYQMTTKLNIVGRITDDFYTHFINNLK